MALCDYRLCDVCGEKAFYDAELGYESGRSERAEDWTPFRVGGAEQHDKPELLQKYAARLQNVGDWAVICIACAKTNRTAILPMEIDATMVTPADQPQEGKL